jgi:hypothetical protein
VHSAMSGLFNANNLPPSPELVGEYYHSPEYRLQGYYDNYGYHDPHINDKFYEQLVCINNRRVHELIDFCNKYRIIICNIIASKYVLQNIYSIFISGHTASPQVNELLFNKHEVPFNVGIHSANDSDIRTRVDIDMFVHPLEIDMKHCKINFVANYDDTIGERDTKCLQNDKNRLERKIVI